MRTVAADRQFIDFTIVRFGVRVRRTSCRTIAFNEREWEEYGDEVPLPVPASRLDPASNEDWGDLAGNVSEYEEVIGSVDRETGLELRRLLRGEVSLDDALRDG